MSNLSHSEAICRNYQRWARDNTAATTCNKFSGQIVVVYCITAIFVAATPIRHRGVNF